jgi:hypothetical protein
MSALLPENLRAGELANMLELLIEADAVLERLAEAGDQRCGVAVQLLAQELANSRQRLRKQLTRLRLMLPVPEGAKAVSVNTRPFK